MRFGGSAACPLNGMRRSTGSGAYLPAGLPEVCPTSLADRIGQGCMYGLDYPQIEHGIVRILASGADRGTS
jgi:hypothetical protein